ncbi:hypothetical protein KSP40_PGU017866 [Platanthera guangdongensis]|uniref:Integrase catalytic domain-containing protein n=1 Tax=Platanthera guangdongensis TaxID=2320717 RepID=A0ABR2LVW9_9ASPA
MRESNFSRVPFPSHISHNPVMFKLALRPPSWQDHGSAQFSGEMKLKRLDLVSKRRFTFHSPVLTGILGAVYAKLTGLGRNTLKTDIIHLLEGSNLSTADVKFVYNSTFTPISMMLRFPSQSSYDIALRQTLRKGRLYNLEKIYSGQWDITESHDGRTGKSVILVVVDKLSKYGHFIAMSHPYTGATVADVFAKEIVRLHGIPSAVISDRDPVFVMVYGIPRSAVRDDIDRFLSGCNFDPSSFRYVNRPGIQSAVKAITFRVASTLEAINFCIRKNRSVCSNAPVTVRVLQ